MRSVTLLGRRCCRSTRPHRVLQTVHQPVRRQHVFSQQALASPSAPTISSSTSLTDQPSPFSSSSSSSSSSSPTSAATAALFPSGAPVIVSPPSHLYLSPAEQAVRDASVAQHLHRQRRLQAAYDNADNSHLRVSFDLSYSHPTRQAATSLMTQLRVIAHHNRTADYPACLHINALDPRALSTEPLTWDALTSEQKEEETEAAAANQFIRDMRQRWSDSWLMHRTTATVASAFHTNQLVYLSPDAPHILWRITPTLVYVVGGLIDKHSVLTKVSLRAAEVMRVQSARLPIRECLPGGLRKSALNVDVVFALLLHVHQAAERVRHTRPPTSSASAASSATAPVGRSALTVYGLQWFPRRRSKSARAYKRPVVGVTELDEGIDWHRLWCEAFDAVIPPRLRWDEKQIQQ